MGVSDHTFQITRPRSPQITFCRPKIFLGAISFHEQPACKTSVRNDAFKYRMNA